jgi:WD40 repeat protein
MQETYYLYHHYPHPLIAEQVRAECWLLNNALRYSVVAVLEARSHEEAFEAICGQGQRVTMRQGNIIRETLPGDVLVGSNEAWMLMADGALQSVFPRLQTPYKTYTHDGPSVLTLDWSPDGRSLAAGDGQGNVLIHALSDAPTRQTTSYDRHGNSGVHALAWSPDGVHIASSADYYGEVHIWTVDPRGGPRGAAIGSILLCRSDEGERWRRQVECLLWLDNDHLLVGRESGWMVAHNSVNGTRLFATERHHEAITDLARAPFSTRIASASRDHTIRVWLLELPPEQDVVLAHKTAVLTLDWSPDGTLLASCAEGQETILLWQPENGYLVEQIPLSVFSTRPTQVTMLRWSPDGKHIAVGSENGWIQVLDVARGRHYATYQSGSQPVHALSWSPDSCFLAATGGMWRQMVEIWRTEGNQDDNEGINNDRKRREE